MEFSNNKEILTIFDKRGKVVTLATKLAALSGKQIKEFFDIRINKIPRQLNRLALIKVLNNKIQTLNSLSLPKDMFIKLQSYKDFTEFQLQTLFEKIGDDEDFLQYRINLWTLILRNYDILNLMDGEVQHLTRIKKLPMDDFSGYNRLLFEASEDVNKCFDGVPAKQIEEIFNNTFSSEELRRLAEKYGFNIPSRLKKTEFSEFLKQILKSKKKLTVALSKEIDDMTVVQLNSLCEVHEITLSSNLKKNEIIFLLMFLIKKNKLSTSEIKGISDTCGITPLEFTVDIDKIDNFGRGEAKEVIILPQEEPEVEEFEEEPKDLTQDELLKEIAKKLGLIQDDNVEEPKEEVKKPAAKQKATTNSQDSNGQISPAERLALARQRKQELALERKLEEERKALEAERKKFEEEKKIFEEKQAIEKERKEKERLQEILNKLMNKPKEEAEEPAVDEVEAVAVEDEFDDSYYDEVAEEEINDEVVDEEINDEVVDEESDEIQDESVEAADEEETLEESSKETAEEFNDDFEVEDLVFEEPKDENSKIENEPSNDTEEVVEEPLTENTSNLDDMLNKISSLKNKKDKKIKDESYDEGFNKLENIKASEVIENPYYKNKKFAPKKRTGLKVFLIVLGAILFFGAGLVASKFLK